MWKSKSIKLLFASFVVLVFCAFSVFSQEDSFDLELAEFQALVESLSKESYSQEIQRIQSLTDSLYQDLQQMPQGTLDSQSLEELRNYSEQMKSSEFASTTLSEKLSLLSKTSKLSNQIIQDSLTQSILASNWQSSSLQRMNELLESYDRLLTILQKMTKSQLEDIGIVRSELTLAIEDNERLRSQIALNKALAEKMEKELQDMKKSRDFFKKMFFGGIGGGAIIGILAGFFIWGK